MKDDYGYIRGLLEKYYRGETDPAEEDVLKDFFLTVSGFSKSRSDFATIEDLPADMEADRRLFVALAEAEAFGEAPADLDERILAAVEGFSSSRGELATLRKPEAHLRRALIGLAAAAAVIVLVFVLPIGMEKEVTDNTIGSQLAALSPSLSENAAVAEPPSQTERAAEAESPLQSEASTRVVSASRSEAATMAAPEEYTLSEEELLGLEMACKALGSASQVLAYASECVRESGGGITESSQIINRVLE